MEIQKSDIVRALAGRDKCKLFFVIEREREYAYIADGKSRKLESPKRKKLKHLTLEQKSDSRVAEKLRSGEKITNSEIRRTLAGFAANDGE
jgi:ribosomal protein L14E/L6E/L27E